MMRIDPYTKKTAQDGVKWFDTVDEYLAYADKHKGQIKNRASASWAGASWTDAYETAKHGDVDTVREAEAMLDSIDGELGIVGTERRWQRAPVGAFPCVPSYLAGQPDSMWQRGEVSAPKSPVKLVFSPVSSGAIGAEKLRERAVTVLAAAIAIQQVRPVELWVVMMGNGEHQHAIKLRSPFVMSEAAAVMARPGFCRQIMYGASGATETRFSGCWPSWYDHRNPEATDAAARRIFRLDDDAVVVPGIYLEGADEILSDPIAWINRLLDKHRA